MQFLIQIVIHEFHNSKNITDRPISPIMFLFADNDDNGNPSLDSMVSIKAAIGMALGSSFTVAICFIAFIFKLKIRLRRQGIDEQKMLQDENL